MDAIYSVGNARGVGSFPPSLGSVASSASGAPSFGDALASALESVSKGQETSGKLAIEFQSGNPNVSIEETMISLQKSSLDFQAAVQVRNKLVTAYNEIMNMQV